jgi:hypothetical protein
MRFWGVVYNAFAGVFVGIWVGCIALEQSEINDSEVRFRFWVGYLV